MERYSITISSDDRDEIIRAAASEEAFSVVWDMQQAIRDLKKYKLDHLFSTCKTIDEFHSKVYDELEEIQGMGGELMEFYR